MISSSGFSFSNTLKLPSEPMNKKNPLLIPKFRVFRRPRLKNRTFNFTIRNQSNNPFEALFHNLFPQFHSIELIGFSSAIALYLYSKNPISKVVSDIGEWILLTSPTPFNRFVFLRCPSISFPDKDNKLVNQERHFVRGRIKVDPALPKVNAFDDENLVYQRLCISTKDGGVISLDWPCNLNLREEHGLDTTLLLVPGTPEGSMDKNIRMSVMDALNRGFFPIVMNPRGCAGSPLTTARLFTAADSDDISTSIQFINKARPWTTLVAIGWGYGANMLTKYLAEVGEKTPLTAATCIDNPFDLEEANRTHSYHMAVDQNLTGLIDILRSNKELFQGKRKGFDVENAFKAKSVRDFEKAISCVSLGFNSVEDFYSKSSTRSVVGNVKIPVLYIQNDNGSAPMFSIPRSSIAENPFTSLLLCSYLPSSVTIGAQPILSWCQKLAIEWLTAVELGLLKGRHPLLKDVDITINPSRGLVLMEGRAADERGEANRQLDYDWSNALSGYSTNFIKKTLKESDSTHLRSRNKLHNKSRLEDTVSPEIEVGILQQTSSVNAEIVKEYEINSEDIEKGQVLRTAEVVMNMLDVTNPGTLTEEEKKKVLNAVDKGETLMKALQDAVPEEVCGKLTTALSEILNAQGSNLKFKNLLGTSQIPNISLGLKKKIEKKVQHIPDAEGSLQVSSSSPSSHQMGDANDLSDGFDNYQPVVDKFSGELEPKTLSSEKVQKSVDQDGSQPVGFHVDDTIDSIRKETSDSGDMNHSGDISRENTSQYLDNSEKEPDTSAEPAFTRKAEQIGSHDEAIDDDYKDHSGEIAQLDEKEENKPKKNEEKALDSSNDDKKVVSAFKMEEALSSLGSTSEAQPLEQDSNNDQRDSKISQPVLDHTKSVISEFNVNKFSVSQALDALAGIDDSTQVAVNNVFSVIENMISQLEGSEKEGEDKNPNSEFDNNSSDKDQSSEKKEYKKIDSDVKPKRLSGPRSNNSSERKIYPFIDVKGGHAGEEFTRTPVSIDGSCLDSSHSAAQAGKDQSEKDRDTKLLVNDLGTKVNSLPPYITSNVYLDSVGSNFFLNYMPSTNSLDMDTTTALLLDYIPEEGRWKFIEQRGSENDAISISHGVDSQVQFSSLAKVKNTDDVIEPPYIILDSENQPEPVGEYQTTVVGKEEVQKDDYSKDFKSLVRTIVLDSLQVEVDRRLSAVDKKKLQSGVRRDLEHIANALSLAIEYDIKYSQCSELKNYTINSPADKFGTLCGEQIIMSISSAVQETIHLKKVLPLGVIVGSSLAALRSFFYVTTLHDDNQGECLTLDQTKTSGERNHVVNGREPIKKVILNDTVCGKGEDAEMRNLNKGTAVMVGAVTAALGASALLVHQQNSCETDQATENLDKCKEKANFQKEPERLEETIPEKSHNIVTTLAEKAMSVASPVVPMKEDGEVDQERLVTMLADLGQKGGMLRLVGKIALLWGGIRGAMNLTDRLISFLRMAERPLFQRILGFSGMVLVLWSPILLPLLPTLVHSWTTKTTSTTANLACILGLYTAMTILVMQWGKRIRGYENPLKEYGLDLTSLPKIYKYLMGFFGGVMLVLGAQFVNRFLSYACLSWPVIPSSLNVVSWFKLYGETLLLVGQGIITATIVTTVEELLFRSWLTEEIASDLGYYPGIIISGLAFAVSQRSLQAIPALWVLSLGLAGARQRSEGSLSIPIGLRSGIMASSFVLQKAGFIIRSSSSRYNINNMLPKYPAWIMGTDTFQPLSGLVGFAFSLLFACIFFPRNPMPRKTLKRTIRE